MRTSEIAPACASAYVGHSRGVKWFKFNIDLQLGYTPQQRKRPQTHKNYDGKGPRKTPNTRLHAAHTEVCERLRMAGPWSEGPEGPFQPLGWMLVFCVRIVVVTSVS